MICGKTEICIFDRPYAQAVVDSGSFEDIFPINSISNNNTDIEFLISGSSTEYLDLNDSLLSIQLKVTDKDKKELVAASDVAASNYMFHTLFSDVILSLNGVKIEGGNGKYTQKAILETILNYNTDTNMFGTNGVRYRS